MQKTLSENVLCIHGICNYHFNVEILSNKMQLKLDIISTLKSYNETLV